MKELLEGFRWPLVCLTLAIVFLVIFKKQIGVLILRIKSINKSGIETESIPEAQRETAKSEAVQKLLAAVVDSPVLQEYESKCRAELNEKGLEVEGDTIKVLIRYLAAAGLLLAFEQIHTLIFGGQISLLKKLNEVAGQGLSREFVEAHFKHVQEMFEEQLGDWSLEQYLRFLVDRLLVINKGERYYLTTLAVEYLIWIVRNGRSEDRPY